MQIIQKNFSKFGIQSGHVEKTFKVLSERPESLETHFIKVILKPSTEEASEDE